jgi:hypothetical protein
MVVKNDIYFKGIVKEKYMSWLKDWKEKRKLKRYMRKTPEEEYAIYKRRIIRGESEESARAGLKHLKKK